ncbi:nitroreductase [Bremerella cremea]|uniref:Nitroreductase n=1 Tax=Blastopirellula marina TaxID=124 RepID=A0A2S8FS10_9BACT|nr:MULTISPECIES: nitroreductase family protein [Pirellulaceae]PQO34971.1 nitroreductase [Blastopirellula marina]RCS47472.1 nitroreductase [Bremerella cremea]
MTKEASTQHPVHDLIAKRWSPYAFADRAVSNDDLCGVLEAARWAPSSYNEQPWSYIVATKDSPEEFEKVLSCLVEGNQGWAKAAPVLMLGCINTQFKRNGNPNAAAEHDLGLASANLSLEATHRGLSVHQMIGILPSKAKTVFQLPDGVIAKTGLALGYVADPSTLPDGIKERDLAPRERKSLSEFVFTGKWGEASPSVK